VEQVSLGELGERPIAMLGLRKGTVRVVPYSHEWKRLFESEKRALYEHLGCLAVDIQHVGSTAVPDLAAKPILDIAIGVARVADVEECLPLLEGVGYSYAGELFDGDHCFMKGTQENITHHLHLVAFDSERWKNYLYFRDHLRRSTEARQKYKELKADLAAEFPHCREHYTEGKSAFIQGIIQEAQKAQELDQAQGPISEKSRALSGIAQFPRLRGIRQAKPPCCSHFSHSL
jgi:GrpB-like predicted nucleotidyltransferase (UPF0157 family)